MISYIICYVLYMLYTYTYIIIIIAIYFYILYVYIIHIIPYQINSDMFCFGLIIVCVLVHFLTNCEFFWKGLLADSSVHSKGYFICGQSN